MNEQLKQRMSLRGKCLANIVQKIDTWVDEDGHLEMNAIKRLVQNERKNYEDSLTSEDFVEIAKYISGYLGTLVFHKDLKINGYNP